MVKRKRKQPPAPTPEPWLNHARLSAIRLAVEALLALGVVIFVVMRFEEQIVAINWRLVSFVCGGVAAVFAFYRWQMREDNAYDALDMFMKDGRADLNAHFQVIFAALAVWVVVQQAINKQPVTELVLGVLGIFVVGRAAGRFAEAVQSRGPPVDQSQNVNVLSGAKVEAPKTDASGNRAN